MIIDIGLMPARPLPFHVQAALDSIKDGLPPNVPQAQIDAAVVSVVLSYLHKPKLLKTARTHLINFWPLIVELAERDPDQFDAIIIAYAEQTTVLR